MSGPLIDHRYIKRALMGEFITNVTVKKYFSDHDAARIVIEKNSGNFHIIL